MLSKSKLPLDWPPAAPKDMPWELALKMGVAGGIGLFVAHLIDLEFPLYVLLAVATTIDTEAVGSWLLAGYRMIGSLIGVWLAILVVELWSVTPLSAGVVMGSIVVICPPWGYVTPPGSPPWCSQWVSPSSAHRSRTGPRVDSSPPSWVRSWRSW